MLKLSDYIGQVLTDIATGREIADRNSAALSERYQADNFMKGMPVPHYTIDEASFDLPFMVVGVITQGKMDDGVIDEILNVTKAKTTLLIHSFIQEKAHSDDRTETLPAEREPAPSSRSKYKSAASAIANKLVQLVKDSINEEGLKVIKPLDLVDSLCAHLGTLLQNDMPKENKDNPFASEENIRTFCEKYRKILFNEYKDIISTTNGVIIDASTGKLNEYAEDNCLTQLKLTLREQDLDFIVERDEKSGATKRFLALN